MPQRSIRLPDDLHDAIEAEAGRLGYPHTFSSVAVNALRAGLASLSELERSVGMPVRLDPAQPVGTFRVETPAMVRQRKLNEAKGKR